MLVAVLAAWWPQRSCSPWAPSCLGLAPWNPNGIVLLAVSIVLGCWLGAAMGLTMGTLVPPNRISIMFAVILTPLMFTGAVQYPWSSLESLPWFRVVTLFNLLAYLAEGLRGAVVPAVPHIEPWISIVAMLVGGAVSSWIGVWGFIRPAIT
jgi:ABC-2 type transport system permease protein